MSLQYFMTVFATVFLAELGDKTQLATLLFATNNEVSRWLVFIAASAALILASAMGVLAGSTLSGFINVKALQVVAGLGFIAIGVLTLVTGIRH